MRKQSLGILLCLGILVSPAACRAKGNKNIGEAPLPDYFPMRFKYEWKYVAKGADGRNSVFVEKDIHDDMQSDGSIRHEIQTTFDIGLPTSVIYGKEGNMVLGHHQSMGRAGESDFVPPQKLLKNPLVAGDNWEWSGTGWKGIPSSIESAVSGPKEVVIPAGTFKAMKVVTHGTQRPSQTTSISWYAPNIGLVKSRSEVGPSPEMIQAMSGIMGMGKVMAERGPMVSTTELVEYKFPKLEPGELEAELNKTAK